MTAQREKFRAPRLPQINGPARKTAVGEAMTALAGQSNSRFLLYFTGHGDKAKDDNLNNNVFDLWGGETLSVQEMAAQVRKLPGDAPVALVMVQCYSGAFANFF